MKDVLVFAPVHGILSILLIHHISNASIYFRLDSFRNIENNIRTILKLLVMEIFLLCQVRSIYSWLFWLIGSFNLSSLLARSMTMTVVFDLLIVIPTSPFSYSTLRNNSASPP